MTNFYKEKKTSKCYEFMFLLYLAFKFSLWYLACITMPKWSMMFPIFNLLYFFYLNLTRKWSLEKKNGKYKSELDNFSLGEKSNIKIIQNFIN